MNADYLLRLVVAFILGMIVLLCFSSCTYTDGQRSIALGGKGAARGRDYLVIWNNEKSFRDGSMLAGLAVGAWQSVAATRAAEMTSRTALEEATKQRASDNALKATLGQQELEATKATFVPPTP